MKTVCGKCSAEVELPKEGGSPETRCPSCGALFVLPSLAEGEELSRPDAFPGYRVVALVGVGGMGAVYRAIQLSMDREVAIKVLLKKYSRVPRFVTRFEREASALATLSHPNIVGVIDRGRIGDTYYFVMEYVHGRTLRYLVRNDLLSVQRAVGLAIQICEALEAAHAAGVVHRDIKPGNILIQNESGVAKVADFGIVHMVEENGAAERQRRSRLGTAKYMAPEQRGTGEGIDARADIYGLGVTLHEMLTRELPSGPPPSAANRLVPRELDAIVERATRPSREERFQSATEMRHALEAVRELLKRDETAATEIAPELTPHEVPCPQCGQAVLLDRGVCSACGAPLVEPCYRPDCDGVNRVGAERCARCGRHLSLLARQRRDELEHALQQATADIAAGDFAAAAELLEGVQADSHSAFADLRARARELMNHLLVTRPVSPLRGVLVGLGIVLLVAVAALVYWRVTRRTNGTVVHVEKDELKPATATRLTTEARVTTPVRVEPQPPTAPPRDAFGDYLLAITDEAWARHPPAARLLAACDASVCLAAGRLNGGANKRLGATLDELPSRPTPAPDASAEHLAEALDALCRVVAGELRRQGPLANRVKVIAARYAEAGKAAADPRQKLELAASTLYDLAALAALQHDARLDLPTRLVLLDGALAGAAPQGDPGLVTGSLVRTGRLLVRYLRQGGDTSALGELVNDAQRKLDLADQAQDPGARLAYGVEALVEALGAKPSIRGPD